MGHGGKEVRLGPVGPFRLRSRRLQLPVQLRHIDHIEAQQQEHPRRHDAHQRPVHGRAADLLHGNHGQQNPVVRGADARMRKQAFSAGGIADFNGARGSRRAGLQPLQPAGAGVVVGLIKLIEIGILEGVALEDVVSRRIDQGDFRILVFLRREGPSPGEGGNGNNPQQHPGHRPAGGLIPELHGAAEGDGLQPVDGIRIGAGHVHRAVHFEELFHRPVENAHVAVGYGVIPGAVRFCGGGKAGQVRALRQQQMGHDLRAAQGFADVCDGFLRRQPAGVDIVGPASADLLLPQQIAVGHAFHGRRHVFKGLCFGGDHRLPLIADVEHDQGQDRQDDQRVSQIHQALFHGLSPLAAKKQTESTDICAQSLPDGLSHAYSIIGSVF